MGRCTITACTVALDEGRVVLRIATPGEEQDIAVVMSPREAQYLTNRLGKAASDAASAASRKPERTNA